MFFSKTKKTKKKLDFLLEKITLFQLPKNKNYIKKKKKKKRNSHNDISYNASRNSDRFHNNES